MSPSPLLLARRSLFRSLEEPPVILPPTGTLSWAPPGYPNYAGYERRDITNSATQHVIGVGSGRNCVFTIKELIRSRILIQGWNNVVLIGGEVNVASGGGSGALGLYGNDGICHIEGLVAGGAALWDTIGLSMGRSYSSGAPGGTLQLQNCYLWNTLDTNNSPGAGHADNVQVWGTWSGAPATYVGGCGPAKIDRVTAYSMRQAFLWGNHDGECGNLDIRNCDLHQILGPSITWGGHVLMKVYRKGTTGRPSQMTLNNVWVQGHPTMSNRDWVVPDDQGGYDGVNVNWQGTQYPDPTRANKLGNDAQGAYLYWDPTADVTGQVRLGNPPTGEFCPRSSVGMGYVSPGYV